MARANHSWRIEIGEHAAEPTSSLWWRARPVEAMTGGMESAADGAGAVVGERGETTLRLEWRWHGPASDAPEAPLRYALFVD